MRSPASGNHGPSKKHMVACTASPRGARKFAGDYREACQVFTDSTKASAALSRRGLQNLLRDHVGVKHNLDGEIQQVIDSGKLPSHLAKAIDAVRVSGNFAAHPIKSTNTGRLSR